MRTVCSPQGSPDEACDKTQRDGEAAAAPSASRLAGPTTALRRHQPAHKLPPPLLLRLRHKGALQVDVIEAKNLPRMDTVGTSKCMCCLHAPDHMPAFAPQPALP